MNKFFNLIIISFLASYSLQQYNFDMSEFMSSSYYQDMMNCAKHEDLDTCSSVSMTSGVYQCCRFRAEYKYYDSDSERYIEEEDAGIDMCNAWISQDFTDEQIKLMQKTYQEATTFLSINYDYHIPEIKMTYTCPKRTFSFYYGGGSFTEEEKSIMKDENYCLRLYYEGLSELIQIGDIIGYGNEPRTMTKDMCMNGKTLPNSGNTCAYASFNLKLYDGTTEKISTCVLINSASYDTKNLDKLLEQDFNNFHQIDGEPIQSFEVEITNKDGNVMKYDSLTKTVDVPKNGSEKLRKSLFVVLGLLIILL